jgi:hypothetical protein
VFFFFHFEVNYTEETGKSSKPRASETKVKGKDLQAIQSLFSRPLSNDTSANEENKKKQQQNKTKVNSDPPRTEQMKQRANLGQFLENLYILQISREKERDQKGKEEVNN